MTKKTLDEVKESGTAKLAIEREAPPASSHYAGLKPEPIDVIEGWGLNYRLGNAIKYIARSGKKDAGKTAEDYRKAIAYLQREINVLMGSNRW